MKAKSVFYLKYFLVAMILLQGLIVTKAQARAFSGCEPVKGLCIGDRVVTANFANINFGTLVKILPQKKVLVVYDDATTAIEQDVEITHKAKLTDCAGNICRKDRVIVEFAGQYWTGLAVAIYSNTIIMIYLDVGEVFYGTRKNVTRVQENP